MVKILKLPCGHGNLEITDKRENKYIVCPKCLHKWVLYWQPKEKMKLYNVNKA